ncbi:MAG: very short patch repair endonuclease [Verrucomicrobiia bacterium]
MPDIFTKRKRSDVMAAIRSSGNKHTELKLMSIMRANGITGWRRNQALPGRPDFIFASRRLAVFVDGCFWHGCSSHLQRPRQNALYWEDKIVKNQTRDRAVSRKLRRQGWSVIRIWEHSLKRESRVVARLKKAIKGSKPKRCPT